MTSLKERIATYKKYFDPFHPDLIDEGIRIKGARGFPADMWDIIQAQQEIIESNQKSFEAISQDNAGDFSNYSREALIEHVKIEKSFCDNVLDETKKLIGD